MTPTRTPTARIFPDNESDNKSDKVESDKVESDKVESDVENVPTNDAANETSEARP